jgi:hypothetical protein
MHKPGDVMTPAMAREVCERTNSQGVLSGNIAKVGQHFLITEEASKGPRINNLFKVAIIVAEASSSIRREMDLVSG